MYVCICASYSTDFAPSPHDVLWKDSRFLTFALSGSRIVFVLVFALLFGGMHSLFLLSIRAMLPYL